MVMIGIAVPPSILTVHELLSIVSTATEGQYGRALLPLPPILPHASV